MWISNRAFRLFNIEETLDRSMFNPIPDVVKCNDDVLFHDLLIADLYIYRESNGDRSMNRAGLIDPGQEFGGLNCGLKTLAQLETDGQTFNILSENVITQ